MSKFRDHVKVYLDKGLSASKTALDKAGVVVQGLGEIGVLRYELEKLNSQKKKALWKLGEEVYNSFTKEEKKELTSEDSSVSVYIQEIKKLEEDIKKRKEAISEKETELRKEEKSSES